MTVKSYPPRPSWKRQEKMSLYDWYKFKLKHFANSQSMSINDEGDRSWLAGDLTNDAYNERRIVVIFRKPNGQSWACTYRPQVETKEICADGDAWGAVPEIFREKLAEDFRE